MITRVLLALALTVTPPTPPTPAPTPTLPPGTSAALEAGPCPVAVPPGTTCGSLVVPQRRDAPGRTIKVGYAVHRSTAPARRPDPVVYMSGGPGSASLQLTGFLSQMFPDRDVVTVEQRGSRYSWPRLGCPELAQAVLDRLTTAADDTAAAAGRCRARLEQQGVDLRGYTTKEIAADVVALRAALGYPSWNLFGVSYSTRVMVDAAAADPAGTRSVLLDSFLPQSVAWYDDARRNLDDTLTHLGLKDSFDAAARRLDAAPARVTIVDPLRGTEVAARLDGDDVATVMAEALHETGVVAVSAPLVAALAAGRHEPLRPLADAVGDGLVSHELGLYEAVQCQDEIPANTFAAPSRLFTVEMDKAVCAAWKLPAAKPSAATTKAPVLVVGGRYDPTTPPRTSRPAAEALPDARFVEFDGTGHAVFLADACARRLMAAFVEAPTATTNTSGGSARTPASAAGTGCAGQDSGVPPRLAAGDLHVTGAPYAISRSPWLAAPLALFALVALVQLVAGALRGRALAAFAGLAGAAAVGLLVQSAYGLISRNEIALAVGLPSAVTAYGWLAAGAVALTLADLALRRTWWRAGAALTGAGFLIWWFAWFL
ncbi:alpha/beta hydrolase [Nonomuraea roseoviolacea]|uniref:Pimeloyl-ACP methyl ester carboxylesterase n=1 Tax=Nonomuraea roseoviolacea subsp. carminata TaxID=160689 RepID=A0ABT1K7R5_9ACTN|nr:alpha/beta hydrolase [Nonomuraea roseoviolacea]MCP2350038.1 pimeloyl-ACP methyl ester carboxylesterase [Nonomuraea roseoviolacea subsp. carminata]